MKKNLNVNENIKFKEINLRKLKILRADLRLTQEQMAKTLGISKRTYRYIEDGEKLPSIKVKLQINKLYGEELRGLDVAMIVEDSQESEELIDLQRKLIDSLIRENELLREKLLIQGRDN